MHLLANGIKFFVMYKKKSETEVFADNPSMFYSSDLPLFHHFRSYPYI